MTRRLPVLLTAMKGSFVTLTATKGSFVTLTAMKGSFITPGRTMKGLPHTKASRA